MVVKLTRAISHSVGAAWPLGLPMHCSNSSVRGHSIREPSHPKGNQPSVVYTVGQEVEESARLHGIPERMPLRLDIGRRSIASKSLKVLPGRCRLGA